MRANPRIVLDTSVFVSSLLGVAGGAPRRIVDHWGAKRLRLCVSEPMLREYLSVFARVGNLSAGAKEQVIAALQAAEGIVLVRPSDHVRICRDPNDDMFLDCAIAAEADAIVSFDLDLLELGNIRGIPILTPAQFLARLP